MIGPKTRISISAGSGIHKRQITYFQHVKPGVSLKPVKRNNMAKSRKGVFAEKTGRDETSSGRACRRTLPGQEG